MTNYTVETENFQPNGATAQMMQPSIHLVTPPSTPEKSDKVASEIILKAPHGTVTGTCDRLQCLGYIVKIVTNPRDPRGWHLECKRKEDRVRPCNFRRDADGNVTEPLPRPPPPTPARRRVVQRNVGGAAKGPTPSTQVGRGGAVSKQTPESSTAGCKVHIKKNTWLTLRFNRLPFPGWPHQRTGKLQATPNPRRVVGPRPRNLRELSIPRRADMVKPQRHLAMPKESSSQTPPRLSENVPPAMPIMASLPLLPSATVILRGIIPWMIPRGRSRKSLTTTSTWDSGMPQTNSPKRRKQA
jgi:hypothetical protein